MASFNLERTKGLAVITHTQNRGVTFLKKWYVVILNTAVQLHQLIR